jgi:hypothetical protein
LFIATIRCDDWDDGDGINQVIEQSELKISEADFF